MKIRQFNRKQLEDNPSQKGLEQEWARYKYWVMSRSQKSYLELRLLFRENESVEVTEFYSIIDQLEHSVEDKKAETNAFQHVWGYFKKIAQDNEKEKFLILLEDYHKHGNRKQVYEYLFNLSQIYNMTYLLDSYYFDYH